MKRFHVSVATANLERSVEFYRRLFDADPDVQKDDYAKWLLDDPRINFSVNVRPLARGVDHVGLQADSAEEFAVIQERARQAADATLEQPDVECCYARSSKTWVRDPDGLSWETFLTHGPAESHAPVVPAKDNGQACCG